MFSNANLKKVAQKLDSVSYRSDERVDARSNGAWPETTTDAFDTTDRHRIAALRDGEKRPARIVAL